MLLSRCLCKYHSMNSRPHLVPGWGGEMQRASDAPVWKPKGTKLEVWRAPDAGMHRADVSPAAGSGEAQPQPLPAPALWQLGCGLEERSSGFHPCTHRGHHQLCLYELPPPPALPGTAPAEAARRCQCAAPHPCQLLLQKSPDCLFWPQNAYLPWHCQAQARCALGDKEQNVALKWWCVSRIKALDFQSHFKTGGK